MGSDRYIRPRSEETISREAEKCRQIAATALPYNFNIVNFIEEHLQNKLWRGFFEIEFFNRRSDDEDPAFVKYMPLDLHVDRNIWNMARRNIPSARYIIAHEIGHIWLHDTFDLAFSKGKEKQLEYADDIHSAEWQANTFAHHFLVPGYIVDKMQSDHDIAALCAVEQQVAEKRFEDRVKHGKLSIFSGGVSCSRCFRHDVYRTETGARCFFCKSEAPITPGLVYRSDLDLIHENLQQVDSSQYSSNKIISKPMYEGEPCKRCANFTLIRKRDLFECSSCNKTEKIYQQYKLQI